MALESTLCACEEEGHLDEASRPTWGHNTEGRKEGNLVDFFPRGAGIFIPGSAVLRWGKRREQSATAAVCVWMFNVSWESREREREMKKVPLPDRRRSLVFANGTSHFRLQPLYYYYKGTEIWLRY